MTILEENKALVRRFFEELDQGNLDAIDELVDANFVAGAGRLATRFG